MNSNMMVSIDQIGNNMPGGFFVYLAEGDEEVIYVNDVVLDIFGCKSFEEWKELTGGTFKGMVHPEDVALMEESIALQVSSNKKELDYIEYRIIRKDGEVRWVDDYGRLVHTEEYGDVFYVLLRDITDMHTDRDENRRREDVIEGLSADYKSIYLVNLDSGDMMPYQLEHSYFGKIAKEIYEEDLKKADWKTIPPIYAERYVIKEDRELFLKEMQSQRIKERLLEKSAYTVNYRSIEDDGNIAYIQMSIVPVHNDSLHRYAVMGFRDITEQIMAAQKEVADKLNMEMALEREKHANEIKSSFLFNISHDIRTPMNAIAGFTGLAKRHINEPDRLEEYLDKVEESNHYLLSLIDDLLEMSRLDYGRIEVKEEVCDLREELNIVIDMFRAQAEEKQITISEDFEIQEQKVYVDASRFERIMGNLLSNAVKFTPNGGKVKVAARKKQVSDSGYARFEFTVADNGIGMSGEFMKRIYEAFEREESSTKTGYSGTGLGLSITKQLLDILGGSITVNSKKGEGSTFIVNFPLKLADGKQEKSAEDIVPEETSKETGEHRILLVEDIEINRMLAETLLTEEGFLVDSVPDGSDAVEEIRNHPEWYYDLVLMDIQMPVMNGYEATRLIRAMGRKDTAVLPIIALSANARDEDKRMSMESGMNSHVAKPFDMDHLLKTINEHIGESKKSREI